VIKMCELNWSDRKASKAVTLGVAEG